VQSKSTTDKMKGKQKMLKAMKLAGLCLASVLVMGMALAGNASAALLWLVCLKGVGLTKYTTSRCLTASGEPPTNNGWQSLGLLPAQRPTVLLRTLTIRLHDSGRGAGVRCVKRGVELAEGQEGEGTIEEGGKGKVTVAKITTPSENCFGEGACSEKGVEAVEGINLPWNIEVVEGPEGMESSITSGGKGEPGWKVKCNTLLGSQTDECTSETGKPEKINLGNQRSTEYSYGRELLVKATFRNVANGKCSLGGAKTAELTGLVAILLPGGAVSINR
jgi:hypothetical protein